MSPLELVKLRPLMERTNGRPEIKVALIDGPVAMDHPDLGGRYIQQLAGKPAPCCSIDSSMACKHGTFVAGILAAKRGSVAPAICSNCTLLVRPIFPESASANGDTPSAKPEELASAIVETVNAGARVINLSAALAQPSARGERTLGEALDYAIRYNVIVVAAAGNQGMMGSSPITRHSGVVPVAGCDFQGRPTADSNLGNSIGRNGLLAPATEITSLGTDDKPYTSSGTSAAAPFVTGTIALLLSEIPSASATAVKMAICGPNRTAHRAVVPPLLDAWAAYLALITWSRRNAS
jgi:subtilisin family serine protease